MNTQSIKKQGSAEISVINDYVGDYVDVKVGICEKETATLTLYDNGIIRTCSQAGRELLDCSPSELIGQHITRLLPQLADIKLVYGKRANPYLRFLSRMGHRFEVVKMNGTNFVGELFFNDVEYFGQHHLRIIIRLAR